ncbi:MAG: hypothetical protein M3Q65_10860 [Chloroflexota bacterium]|nr:hypothetical protein [Chloroflexota bacterium]
MTLATLAETFASPLLLLAVAGLVYLVLLGGLAALLGRRWGGRPARALWLAVALSVGAIVLAVPLFETIAAAFRHEAPGFSGPYRQDLATYHFWARTAFFTLYGLALALGGLLGYRLGRRSGERGGATSLASALAVLLFLLLTLPVVDFFNACLVGVPFVLDNRC